MAHQAHNISYSKYLKCFDKLKKEELRGSNNKLKLEEIEILSYEFIEIMEEFSKPIKIKIRKNKPYTEKEYVTQVKNEINLYNIANTNYYFDHLCNAITSGNTYLFTTILKYMKKSNQSIQNYNYYYPGYGQAFLGGLCQVFSSFLNAYLLINTLVNSGYKCNEFFDYFENTKRCNKLYIFFSDAFEFSCNDISDNFQKKFEDIIKKIPKIYKKYLNEDELNAYKNGKHYDIPDNISFEELKTMSKEMFRLMYTTYAILTIDDENKINVISTIKKIIEKGLFN